MSRRLVRCERCETVGECFAADALPRYWDYAPPQARVMCPRCLRAERDSAWYRGDRKPA